MTSLHIVPTEIPLIPLAPLDIAFDPTPFRDIDAKPHLDRPTLSPWRLKRVLDYIEAHFAESIRLADLARRAGLSRMYFAAQFRVATSLRPREYLLRKRVIHAQRLMATSQTPLVEIALAAGFQSQAYFTTVFKRFVGEPPHRWRRRHRSG